MKRTHKAATVGRANRMHIVFAGGGTGGHLFPGLAVAEQLPALLPEAEITFVGSGKQFERRRVTDAGWGYAAMACRPPPQNIRETFSFVTQNVAGYWAAQQFLAAEHVDVVIGLGGYASVPLALAASRRGVPLILLEQNAVAGRATRWLARRADLICLALEEARSGLRCRCPVYVTGNPVRAAFEKCLRPVENASKWTCVSPEGQTACATACQDFENSFEPGEALLAGNRLQVDSLQAVLPANTQNPFSAASSGTPWFSCRNQLPLLKDELSAAEATVAVHPTASPQLLVLGGSSGAQSLNESVPRALSKLGPLIVGWRIVHQAGGGKVEAARLLYQQLALPAMVVDFIADMPEVLADSTLAVCRAGGTTLAELALAGVPAVLLPYPHAADNHQRRNAEVLAAAGAAMLVDERETPGRLEDRLAESICPLLISPVRRREMSLAMRRLARPDAAAQVANLIRAIVAGESSPISIPRAA